MDSNDAGVSGDLFRESPFRYYLWWLKEWQRQAPDLLHGNLGFPPKVPQVDADHRHESVVRAGITAPFAVVLSRHPEVVP